MIATGRIQQRRWASGTDQMLAGARFVALFGELDVPHVAVLDEALTMIAAAGSYTRVALDPLATKRLWRYTPSEIVTVSELPASVVEGGKAAILQHIRRRPGTRAALEIHATERHIALDVDHGLGDGRFALDLISALFECSSGRRPRWMTDTDTPLALLRSVIRTFGANPQWARMAVRYATEQRFQRPTDIGVASTSPAWGPSFAVRIAHVDANAEAAVQDWRCAHAGRPGSAAVWLYIVRQALQAAGLSMTDRVMTAFDCRRYLSRRQTTNGNFIIGLEVPFAIDDGLSAVSTRIRELGRAAVPLAGMAVVSARAMLRIRRHENSPASCYQPGAPVHVMYSDLGTIKMIDDAPWRSGGERSLTALLDTAGPHDVTVLNTRIGDTRSISISFNDNVVERHIIDRAVHYLADPMRFLPLPSRCPS
jgi:hypothetical protein